MARRPTRRDAARLVHAGQGHWRTGRHRATTHPTAGLHAGVGWSSVWPGGFIKVAQVRRAQSEPGRASFWVRTGQPLVADEPVSPTARAAGLFDIANGMTVRTDPRVVAFPNVDLTAHLFRQPCGDWLGFDTTVTFGPTGLGLTSSVLHDADGPYGTLAQMLTVRPVPTSGT